MHEDQTIMVRGRNLAEGSPNSIRPKPCVTCPYRRDVPSSVWDLSEYEKMLAYDEETASQPASLFMCHSAPAQSCSGWATCHQERGHTHQLLALRIHGPSDVPLHDVEVFRSGRESYDHGVQDIAQPSIDTFDVIAKVENLRDRIRS